MAEPDSYMYMISMYIMTLDYTYIEHAYRVWDFKKSLWILHCITASGGLSERVRGGVYYAQHEYIKLNFRYDNTYIGCEELC